MSLIKAIKAQLGLSVTPANNFTLDASADNGTMKLARNSGQNIMTVDSLGRVGLPQNLKTWNDVIASRAVDTLYTNNFPYPIEISVSFNSAAGTSSAKLQVQGVQVSIGWAQFNVNGMTLTCQVPAGAQYGLLQVAGPTQLAAWSELY